MNKFERYIVNNKKEDLARFVFRAKLVRQVLKTGEKPNYLHDKLAEKSRKHYDLLESIRGEIFKEEAKEESFEIPAGKYMHAYACHV